MFQCHWNSLQATPLKTSSRQSSVVARTADKHPSALSSVCVPGFGSCLSPLNLVQALDGYMFLQQGFKCTKNAFLHCEHLWTFSRSLDSLVCVFRRMSVPKKGELPDQKDTEKIYKNFKQVTEWKELHSGDAVTLLRWTCHGVWDSDDVGCCDSVLTILISRTSTTNCRSSAMVSQRQTCSCSCQNPISGNLTPAQRAMGTIALSVALMLWLRFFSGC